MEGGGSSRDRLRGPARSSQQLPAATGFLGAGAVLAGAVHEADGAVLQAAGGRDADRAAALGPAQAYGSYDEVVASPEVDAVYVALSNDAHLPWTLAALRAGKAVLCEKSLGLTAAEAEVHAGISVAHGQWLVVVRGDRGELELRDAPYTSWKADATGLWVSDGTGTERCPVAPADPYRLMVEEVSSVLRGGPGWALPLEESRQTAAVLDAARASAAAGGEPVRPS